MHAKSLLLYFDRTGLPTYLEQHKREESGNLVAFVNRMRENLKF